MGSLRSRRSCGRNSRSTPRSNSPRSPRLRSRLRLSPRRSRAAPQAPAPSEGERVADEAGGDSDNGLALWLLPVLGLLAFVGGVVGCEGCLAVHPETTADGTRAPGPAEQAAAKPEAKPSTGDGSSPHRAPPRLRRAPPRPRTQTSRCGRSRRTARKEKPTPVKSPAPVVAAKPAPVKEQKPRAPVKESPAPVKAEKPAPAKAAPPKPAPRSPPAKKQRPAPATAEKPAMAKAEKPAVAKAEKPAPVTPQKPAPVVAQKPAAAPEQKPAPVRAQGPSRQRTRRPGRPRPRSPSSSRSPSSRPRHPRRRRRAGRCPTTSYRFPRARTESAAGQERRPRRRAHWVT